MARNHDALFDAVARKGFCAGLRRHGYTYEILAAELERAGMPRPSEGSAVYRSMILQAATWIAIPNPTELCARISPLYQPELHLGSALPQEDDGYLAALLGTPAAPVCAEAAPPTHTTHCGGERLAFFFCMRAIIPSVADCSDPEAA